MTTKVLLIGHGVFHDGLEHLLAEQSSMSIVGTSDTWAEAQEMVAQLRPDILIVEQEAADLYENDLTPLLEMHGHTMKIIYLTLSESRMIIHDRQEVDGATVDHLLEALQMNSIIRPDATAIH